MISRVLVLIVALLTSAFAPDATFNSAAVRGIPIENGGRLLSGTRAPDKTGFDSNYKLGLPHPVQDKNFYLLSLFQRNRGVRRRLTENRVLKQFANDKVAALEKAADCGNVDCFDELMRFDARTIDAV